VVSGLAEGIDTAAHQGALKGGGRTLAVMGSGIDQVYPASNRELAAQIADHGAVMSEFPFGRQPDRTTFPIRNRIVSGLSKGIVVVEAGLKSGAMITARQAAEQGRDVFAVPGRIDSPASQGCHELIRTGAALARGVEDILAEYEFLLRPTAAAPAARTPPVSADEGALLKLLEDGEQDVDSLIRASGLPTAAVSSALVCLELKRMVRVLPGRIVERVHGLAPAAN
jgi:DNA processing protein